MFEVIHNKSYVSSENFISIWWKGLRETTQVTCRTLRLNLHYCGWDGLQTGYLRQWLSTESRSRAPGCKLCLQAGGCRGISLGLNKAAQKKWMKKSRDQISNEPLRPVGVNLVNHSQGGQGGTKIRQRSEGFLLWKWTHTALSALTPEKSGDSSRLVRGRKFLEDFLATLGGVICTY